MGLPDPYSPSVVTVQHQLINGSLPQLMVVSSTKVPPAQFISASVSAVVSGAFSAEALIPSGNAEDVVEAKVKEEAEEKRKRDAEAEERRKNREAEAAKRSRIAGKLAGTPRLIDRLIIYGYIMNFTNQTFCQVPLPSGQTDQSSGQ